MTWFFLGGQSKRTGIRGDSAKTSLCESVSCGILALLVGGGGGGGAGLAFASECASGAL